MEGNIGDDGSVVSSADGATVSSYIDVVNLRCVSLSAQPPCFCQVCKLHSQYVPAILGTT